MFKTLIHDLVVEDFLRTESSDYCNSKIIDTKFQFHDAVNMLC
mgnify:CR=1 FL=1